MHRFYLVLGMYLDEADFAADFCMSTRHVDYTSSRHAEVNPRQRSWVVTQATVDTQARHAEPAAEIPTGQICLEICVQGLHADPKANPRVIAR